MRHKEIVYFIPNHQNNRSLYKISRGSFGPKSNLDVPDENHTKGIMRESNKLKFKKFSFLLSVRIPFVCFIEDIEI